MWIVKSRSVITSGSGIQFRRVRRLHFCSGRTILFHWNDNDDFFPDQLGAVFERHQKLRLHHRLSPEAASNKSEKILPFRSGKKRSFQDCLNNRDWAVVFYLLFHLKISFFLLFFSPYTILFKVHISISLSLYTLLDLWRCNSIILYVFIHFVFLMSSFHNRQYSSISLSQCVILIVITTAAL